MGLFSKIFKKEKSCKDLALENILSLFRSMSGALNIFESDDSLYELQVSAIDENINELIGDLSDCEDMPDIEIGYWAANLNVFAATITQNILGVESAFKYYENAIDLLKQIEEDSPYPYYDTPNILTDVKKYSFDDVLHLAAVRRRYVTAISLLGDDAKTEKMLLKNLETDRKSFESDPETVLSFADTLFQIGCFYNNIEPFKALKFCKESISIVEERADLKTNMKHNDLRLLRHKLEFQSLLFSSIMSSEDTPDDIIEIFEKDDYKTIVEELRPYEKYKVKALTELNIFESMASSDKIE